MRFWSLEEDEDEDDLLLELLDTEELLCCAHEETLPKGSGKVLPVHVVDVLLLERLELVP